MAGNNNAQSRHLSHDVRTCREQLSSSVTKIGQIRPVMMPILALLPYRPNAPMQGGLHPTASLKSGVSYRARLSGENTSPLPLHGFCTADIQRHRQTGFGIKTKTTLRLATAGAEIGKYRQAGGRCQPQTAYFLQSAPAPAMSGAWRRF